MQKIFTSKWITPIALSILTVLGFGLLLSKLGFYQDDWTQIWFGRAFGPGIYIDFFAPVRPFIAWMYLIFTSLLGDSPFAWQVFGLFTRFLAALVTYFLVLVIWPEHERAAGFVAVAFLIYPGFRQQFLPVMYSQYFVQYIISISSLILMVYSIRGTNRGRILKICAFFTALVGLFTSEYFFGIEIMRPLIIGAVLAAKPMEFSIPYLRRVLVNWLPYLAIVIFFLIWRVFIFQFPTYQPVEIFEPGSTLGAALSNTMKLIGSVLYEAFHVGMLVWLEPFQSLYSRSLFTKEMLFVLIVAFAGSLVAFIYFSRNHTPASGTKSLYQMLLVGAVGILGVGIPFWFVGLSANTIFYGSSRLLISFMLPASLVLGALLALLSNRHLANLAAALIVGISFVRHLEDSFVYREIHKMQAIFFQQLAWRAPDLEAGTVLLVNQFQTGELIGDNSLTTALNFIYQKDPPYDLKNVIFYLPDRLVSGDLPGLEPGKSFVRTFHTAHFEGTTDKALVMYYDPPSCLRILDPMLDQNLPRPISMPLSLFAASRISNLSMIKSGTGSGAQLPDWLFKYHYPKDSWCYIYENADLARQRSDWQEIVKLYENYHVTAKDAFNPWELLPFIEGLSRMGDWENARSLTLEMLANPRQPKKYTTNVLCRAWVVMADNQGSDDLYDEQVRNIINELNCKQNP